MAITRKKIKTIPTLANNVRSRVFGTCVNEHIKNTRTPRLKRAMRKKLFSIAEIIFNNGNDSSPIENIRGNLRLRKMDRAGDRKEGGTITYERQLAVKYERVNTDLTKNTC